MMQNVALMSPAAGRTESFLTRILVQSQNQGSVVASSPSGVSTRLGLRSVWPQGAAAAAGIGLASSPLGVHMEGLLGMSSAAPALNGGERNFKEESMTKASTLSDDAFFLQYAKTYDPEKINKNEPFPIKLYRILYEAEKNNQEDIISWCPSGRSFKIHNIDEFVAKIMPKYFTSNRMTSFQRQLNLYGWRRRLRGDDKGGFWHECFVQGQRNLCLNIKRKVQSFKIPPHLLTNHPASPSASPASPTISQQHKVALPPPPPTPGHMVAAQSPALKAPPAMVTPSFNHKTRHQQMIVPLSSSVGSPSLRSTMMANVLPPPLPILRLNNEVAPVRRTRIVSRATTSSTTAELLHLNQKIQLAKERAAMKQQLAVAAIHRLVSRVDL